MARFNAAKMLGAIDEKFQYNFNQLIDLLDTGYMVESTIADKKIRIEIAPKDGIKITADGTSILSIDPITGEIVIGSYDATIAAVASTVSSLAGTVTTLDGSVVKKDTSYAGVSIGASTGFVSTATIDGETVVVKLNSTGGLEFYQGAVKRGGLAIVAGLLTLATDMITDQDDLFSYIKFNTAELIAGEMWSDTRFYTYNNNLLAQGSQFAFEISNLYNNNDSASYTYLLTHGISDEQTLMLQTGGNIWLWVPDEVYARMYLHSGAAPEAHLNVQSTDDIYCSLTLEPTEAYVNIGGVYPLDVYADRVEILGNTVWHAGNLIQTSDVFTPTLYGLTTAGSPTYGIREGSYCRSGNLVHCDIFIRITALGGAAGGLLISGLPFASKNRSTKYVSAVLSQYSGVTFPAGYYTLLGQLGSNDTEIKLFKTGSNVAAAYLTSAEVAVTLDLVLSIDYEIA